MKELEYSIRKMKKKFSMKFSKCIVKMYCFYFLLLILGGTCNAQSIIAKDAVSSFFIASKILREKYKVIVVLPESYKTSNKNYPIVYILDGEYYSTYTAEASSLLAQSQLTPECIIIGICTNNRNRDFSPSLDQESGQTQDIHTAGGGDQFLEYIEKELISTIVKRYRTQDYKVIIGHSTGGLLAYYSLYKKPGLFQGIIAIDASTWWNKGKVGKEIIDYLDKAPSALAKLYECRKDLKIPVRFPANTELLNYLDKSRPKGLEYKYLELKNETHGTIVFPCIYHGLKYLFNHYIPVK